MDLRPLSWLFTGALAAVLFATAPAVTAQPSPGNPSTAALPDTPEGRLATELVEALNSGNEDVQRRYAATRLVRASDEAELLVEAYRQSGGVDIVRFSAGPGTLQAVLRGRRTNRLALLRAAVDSTGQRLVGFNLRPMLSPLDSASTADHPPLEAVRTYLGRLAEREEFSGVVLVASGERVLWQQAYGWADRDRRIPVRLDTRFHIASAGKMFTAVAIAQLVEQGKLRFADTLGALLPEYPNAAARQQITVHHLLTHTSGLGGLFDRPGFDRRRRVEWQRELLPLFAGEPLPFTPGTRDLYSNEGFVVLGAIVERLSGMPFDAYLERHVFRPAEMRGAACEMVGPSGPASADAAINYATASADPFGLRLRESSADRLGWECGAAGGEYLGAADLLAFARSLHDGRLVSVETLRALLTARGVAEWRGYGFERHTRQGYAVYGHGGSGGMGISAELRMVPDGPGGAPLTVVVLSNYDSVARPVTNTVLDLMLAPRRPWARTTGR